MSETIGRNEGTEGTNANIGTVYAAISEVDSNNDFVRLIYQGEGEEKSFTYEANGNIYVCLSSANSTISCFQIQLIGLQKRVDEMDGDIQILEDTTRALYPSEMTTGSYRAINGLLATLNGYFYTSPIKVHKGDKVTTTEAINIVTVVSVISRVSFEGQFISSLYAGAGSSETVDYTVDFDGYIEISATNTKASLFRIKNLGIPSELEVLATEIDLMRPDIGTLLPTIGTNPLASIRRDAGYGSIIRKWGIIGDSLSSGEMQCFNDESSSSSDYKFVDMYQYSTGQVFARLIGATAYNFSNGGQTTWGWLKNQATIHDASYIGGVGGGGWELAQQSEYLQDGYIIAMGINDRAKINNGDYELGSISQITAYDGTNSDIDDTTTYPKSFVRYYAGIIQRIKSVQPKAKIFCVTPLGGNYAEIAQAIRDIVTYFGDIYLIDIRQYIPSGYNVAGYMLNGHLSPMGYAYWGYMYNTYIDWIIRTNGSAFRDTALIGTDYRPDYS